MHILSSCLHFMHYVQMTLEILKKIGGILLKKLLSGAMSVNISM